MQPTKYPSQVEESPTGSDSVGLVAHSFNVMDGCRAPSARPQRSEDVREGAKHPRLDRRTLNVQRKRIPVSAREHGGHLLKNWMVPASWNGVKEGERNFVLKIQSFAKGGYEGTIRLLDLEKIGRAIEGGGTRGKREAPEKSLSSIRRRRRQG